jgi:hypothetical protein
MAREESEREDLLREATALVERIALAPRSASGSATAHVVAGFRRDGGLSIFFGDDPVYQFNAAGEVRRAYCDGKLVKAVGGRLANLSRVRTGGEVQLVRHDLSDAEESAFIQQMTLRICELTANLNDGQFEIVGQVPAGAEVLDRLRSWLNVHQDWPIASRPNA